ncbi:MAG: neutral/alkaline non-lysosomal ceramidase N-terminal domain-containing protein [Planctomycetales bacterium]|nr:neutral/alkaline non-lysosomal ceramidase N-terminal domain-containing protein [Planctomycetales bacterium]
MVELVKLWLACIRHLAAWPPTRCHSIVCVFCVCITCRLPFANANSLKVGFAQADITPDVQAEQPVWLAGYGWGRRATAVHDSIFVRTSVLDDGQRRIAIVGADVIGLQYPEVERIRAELPGFAYVLVASTHNHEGPDTIGIWGKTPFQRGVDSGYLDRVVAAVVGSVKEAARKLQPATAHFGAASDASLVGDSRLPEVKDATLRTIRFTAAAEPSKNLGMLVQWNSHPESMGPHNTEVTADFCGVTVACLEREHACPVVYLSGAIGGLLAPPRDFVDAATGERLREGDFKFMNAYGTAVAELANRALRGDSEVALTPFACQAMQISIPLANPLYRTARIVGVVHRQGVLWTGDFHDVRKPHAIMTPDDFAVKTEVGCLRLGDFHLVAIPGELYPELVYGDFQQPPDPAADHHESKFEKPVAQLFPTDKWMIAGLANDEVGYLIPKSQWDWDPPFAYGRQRPQYGEINSCGPESAPIVMQALDECVRQLTDAQNPAAPE